MKLPELLKIRPILLLRTAEHMPQPYKENTSPETQFYTHRQPYALQAHQRRQPCSQGKAYSPNAYKVHHTGNYGIPHAYKDSIRHNRRRKHRFSKSLNAQCFRP